jgi:hypothetical protein
MESVTVKNPPMLQRSFFGPLLGLGALFALARCTLNPQPLPPDDSNPIASPTPGGSAYEPADRAADAASVPDGSIHETGIHETGTHDSGPSDAGDAKGDQ